MQSEPGVQVLDLRQGLSSEYRATHPPAQIDEWLEQETSSNAGRGPAARARAVEPALRRAHVVTGSQFFPLDLVRRAPSMRWFHLAANGADLLRRGDLWASDVVLTTCRGRVGSAPMAEYVHGAILYFARGFHLGGTLPHRLQSRKAWPLRSLRNATVGIIGLGGVGRETARRMLTAGAKVLAIRRRSDDVVAVEREGLRITGARGVAALVAECEFVVLACPLTTESRSMVDDQLLRRFRRGSVIVNVARTDLVDELAVADALADGLLTGYACDLTAAEDHPGRSALMTRTDVLLTPHVSSGSPEIVAEERLGFFRENLRHYRRTGAPVNVVDRARGY